MRRLIIFMGIAALFAVAHAQTPKEQLRALQQQAMAANKAGNFAECAKNFAAALAMRPHHPRLLYNFAACSAKAGATNDAIAALNDYAGMGLIADIEKDDDFASLKGTPAFNAILDKLHANGKPIGESKIVARLSEPFLAEGIAYDPASKRFFISSVDQRKIVQVTADGTISDFVRSGQFDLLGAFGMAIDAKRNLLWVASSGVPHARDLKPDQRGTAGVIIISLKDGHRDTFALHRPPKDKELVIGDVAVTTDGTAFASDSIEPEVYSWPPTERWAIAESSRWLRSESFGSLQGITFAPDEKTLIVADYAAGLHFIDRTTKAATTVRFAGGTTLLGIDGIYRVGNQLIAIQNGVAPTRILSLTLDASGRGITSAKVLSANDPNIPEPSLGTIVNDDFCVVANAQWSRFNDDGTRKQDLDPPRIACIKLK